MSSINEFTLNYLKPIVYLTFENDQYDGAGITTQETNPFIIPDDSGLGNHAKCFNERVASMDGYKLGERALYELSNDTNKSIMFGRWYDVNPLVHSYITVENSLTMRQQTNALSISFFANFANTQTPVDVYDECNVVRKDNLFSLTWIRSNIRNAQNRENRTFRYDVFYRDRLNTLQKMTLTFPWVNNSLQSYNGVLITLRLKYESNEVTADVSFNGKIVASNTVVNMDGGLDVNNSASLYIGGTPRGAYQSLTDVMTTEHHLEHVMFFQRWVSDSEIMNLVKRSQEYTTIIRELNPVFGMHCQDNDTLNLTSVSVQDASFATRSLNGIEKVSLRLKPVDEAYTSIRFSGYTSLETYPTYSNPTYNFNLTTSNKKTITMWVLIQNTMQTTLLNTNAPFSYYGEEIRLWANSSNFNHSIGSICFSDENGKSISSNGANLSDGQWHHIAMVMDVNSASLYVDGSLQGSYDRSDKKTHNISNIAFFSNLNNTDNTTGNMAFFNIFNSILPPHVINLLYSYSFFFTVSGITRLSGVPVSAELRLYNLWTGTLIDKVVSSNTTGEYRFITDDGGHKQLVALNTKNSSIIPKVEAPIIPRINLIER